MKGDSRLAIQLGFYGSIGKSTAENKPGAEMVMPLAGLIRMVDYG